MKVNSSVRPNKFYIRKRELGEVFIKLRKNIEEVEEEIDSGEVETIYNYDEVEVKIVDRGNLEEYINNNFEPLFKLGIRNKSKKEISDAEKIEELEETLMEMSILQANTEMALMELTSIIEGGM